MLVPTEATGATGAAEVTADAAAASAEATVVVVVALSVPAANADAERMRALNVKMDFIISPFKTNGTGLLNVAHEYVLRGRGSMP